MAISLDARISPGAIVADDAEVGPFTIVHGRTRIGPGARISSHCELGTPPVDEDAEPLTIGARAHIRSHTILYAGSRIGDDFETGHRVIIRERSLIGCGVRIGTLGDVQGDCLIEDHARLHSSVFVAKLSVIRRFAWLMPRVTLTNDPTPPSEHLQGCEVGEYAVLAAGVLVMPGVVIGAGALVAAQACVCIDVPPGMVAMGVPARITGMASAVRLREQGQGSAYPWTRHFHRGYPAAIVEEWQRNPIGRGGEDDAA
jgi:acetyltransferase-like isoleucine patch superfamily enzyme